MGGRVALAIIRFSGYKVHLDDMMVKVGRIKAVKNRVGLIRGFIRGGKDSN
ncbi:MAG: hypothetical protein ACO2OZ_00585 [Acidilobaceae archaeon]